MHLMNVCLYAQQLATRPLKEFSKADVDYRDLLLRED